MMRIEMRIEDAAEQCAAAVLQKVDMGLYLLRTLLRIVLRYLHYLHSNKEGEKGCRTCGERRGMQTRLQFTSVHHIS